MRNNKVKRGYYNKEKYKMERIEEHLTIKIC